MNRLNVFRLAAIVAFLGLAGFSCFWTAESLYIWQPSITIYGAWLLAVVFYLMASICFGKFLKSLDKNEDYYGKLFGRAGALLIALTGLIFFWIIFSLPTNTHTLLYRAAITNTLITDLNRTQGYLLALKDNNIEIKKIEQKYAAKEMKVNNILQNLNDELRSPGNEGPGPKFHQALGDLENALSEGLKSPVKLQQVKNPGSSLREWNTTYSYYADQARSQLHLYRIQCDKEIQVVRSAMQSKPLDNLIHNNQVALSDINRMKGVSQNIINAALMDLDNSYSYIHDRGQYIDFSDGDRELYTRDGAIPEARAMLSVYDVWKDYLTTDKYTTGHGFQWWVLIALLVDIAAFVFFNIAFNSKNENSL